MWFTLNHYGAGLIRRQSAAGKADARQLCQALRRDHDPEVRLAAAEILAVVGDEQALPALTEALQSYYVRQSSRCHTAGGIAVALLAVGVTFSAVLLSPALAGVLDFPGLRLLTLGLAMWALVTVGYYSHYQGRKRVAMRAMSEAILKITERTRSAQARQALQHLRTTASDFLQYDDETRRVSHTVAQRVDLLTHHLDKLPIPATTPLEADTLPRPSQPAPIPTETLPRVGV